MASMTVTVKSKLNDDLRRFSLAKDEINFATLVARLQALYFKGEQVPLVVKYEDEDGDLVSISTDVELRDVAVTTPVLRLTISQASTSGMSTPQLLPEVAPMTTLSPATVRQPLFAPMATLTPATVTESAPAARGSPAPASAAAAASAPPAQSDTPVFPITNPILLCIFVPVQDRTFEVIADVDDTVAIVKHRIAATTPIKPRKQELSFNSRVLADDAVLRDAGVESASTLHLRRVAKPDAGEKDGDERPARFVKFIQEAAADPRVLELLNRPFVARLVASHAPQLLPQLLSSHPQLVNRLNSGRFCKKILPVLLANFLQKAPALAFVLTDERVQSALNTFLPRVAAQLASYLDSIPEVVAAGKTMLASATDDADLPLGELLSLVSPVVSDILKGSGGRHPLADLFQRFGGCGGCPYGPQSAPSPAAASAAADAASAGPATHTGVSCDGCGMSPIVGNRFKCMTCYDFDLCATCQAKNAHDITHPLILMAVPRRVAEGQDGIAMVGPGRLGPQWQHPHRRRFGGWGMWRGAATPGACGAAASAAGAPCADAEQDRDERTGRNHGVARFVRDVTFPPNSKVVAGTSFTKTWTVRNDGGEQWPAGTRLIHVGGDTFGDNGVTVASAAPGQEVQISLQLAAPHLPGRYVGYWRLVSSDGKRFGQRVCADVLVITREEAGLETPRATAIAGAGAAPAAGAPGAGAPIDIMRLLSQFGQMMGGDFHTPRNH